MLLSQRMCLSHPCSWVFAFVFCEQFWDDQIDLLFWVTLDTLRPLSLMNSCKDNCFMLKLTFSTFDTFSQFGKSRKNSTKRNLKMHITIQYLLSFWFFSGIPKSLSFWLPLGMQLVLETSGDFRTWLRKMEAVNVWKQFKLFSHARVDFMNCFAPEANLLCLALKFYTRNTSQKLGVGRELFSIECKQVYEIDPRSG